MVDMSKIRMFLYLREIQHTKCVWRFNCNFFFACLSEIKKIDGSLLCIISEEEKDFLQN